MLLILPYKTSIRPRKTPYANYMIIAANILLFIVTYHVNQTRTEYLWPWAEILVLNPAPYHLHLWQFVSYAFLHGGLMHILGNMYFLYLFGNNVNDKLGNVGYTAFYLAGAIFSGIGHCLLSTSPVLGASGAVAAVTGAYMVLFPQTLISVFWWFFYFINTIEISAIYFIAFKLIIFDNMIEPGLTNQVAAVAYTAHVAGYSFGILSITLLLATKLITSTHFDLWDMIRQWNRRRQFRDVVSNGFDPFSGTSRFIKVKEIKKTPVQEKAEKESIEIRMEISKRIIERNLPEAAELYIKLMAHDKEQVLPRQQLLDIANQLAGQSMHLEAAKAYEQFLKHYNNYEYSEQVELMLGIIYARYLNQTDLAIKHLKEAEVKLTDTNQLRMCRDELEKLQK